jgi:hypothetical protein
METFSLHFPHQRALTSVDDSKLGAFRFVDAPDGEFLRVTIASSSQIYRPAAPLINKR